MKVCPKCTTEHDKKGIFCSRSCANSRTFSEEAIVKKSESQKLSWQNKTEEQRDAHISHLKDNVKKRQDHWENFRTNTDTTEIKSSDTIKKKLWKEQNKLCSMCNGTDEWLGKKLVMELHHKDGDNTNNVRENLEVICPNCHSTTDTWRIGIKRKKI